MCEIVLYYTHKVMSNEYNFLNDIEFILTFIYNMILPYLFTFRYDLGQVFLAVSLSGAYFLHQVDCTCFDYKCGLVEEGLAT